MLKISRILKAEMESAVLDEPKVMTKPEITRLVSQAADATQPPAAKGSVNSAEFKAWFGKSAVVGKDGRPQKVYHGSTHTFDRFTQTGANSDNFYGPGYYFTDDTQDVSENYATPAGADLTARIENRAEELVDLILEEEGPDGDYDGEWEKRKSVYEIAKERARAELVGQSHGQVYVTYLRIERPAVVKKSGGTYFPGAEYDPEDEDAEPKESRIMAKLFVSFRKACESMGVRYFNPISDEGYFEGCSAYEFEQIVRGSDDTYDAEGGPGPLIAKTYQLMGFDGIIMDASSQFTNMKMSPGTKHYIVWNPRQVKSAIGNSGAFNRRSPRMTASVE